MSKMDALRAMRERATPNERHELPARRAAPAARNAPEPAAAEKPPAEPIAADDLLCGHRNMGGAPARASRVTPPRVTATPDLGRQGEAASTYLVPTTLGA